jgi:transcriptional regulator with XRE-family HTH domain
MGETRTIINTHVLRSLREARGWDQQQLSTESGVNQSVISRLERGLQIDLKVSVLLALSRALQTPIERLLLAPYQPSPPVLTAELGDIVQRLGHLSAAHQHQVTLMLRGYMAGMPDPDTPAP